MSSPRRILVTAALPYANGDLHLGHLAGAYLPADIYVRYQRLQAREVLFICGSDENGVAITVSAEKEGVSPQVIVDRYHERNRLAFERFGMSFDNYSRTSLPVHHQVASEFFLELFRQGIMREKREKQFFDETAGRFLPDRYVEGTCPVCSSAEARGDQCERCGSYLNPMDLIEPRSKISGSIPTVRETTHLFFPLGSYQGRLEAYIAERDQREGWKENVLQYCRGWFKDGLQDRAITRDLDWGVPVPVKGFEQKVIYVWFDAVLGYISSTIEWARRKGEPEAWKRFWQERETKYVAFIGKDNVVFHCIVFPAMLLAWNDAREDQYVLPENVPANEFLNFEGQKFSKSKGWGIDVRDFLDRYSADSLRYYLATALPEYRDSDFTWRDFQARNNNELADILGNFINRTLAFIARTFEGNVPARGELSERDRGMLELLGRAHENVGNRFERYEVREGVLAAMNVARAANKYFNDSQPWATARSNPELCATTLSVCVQVVRGLAILFAPVIPSAADRIWEMLGLQGKPSDASWESIGSEPIAAGHRTGTPAILFTKIEDSVIENERKSLGVPGTPAEATPGPNLITIDDVRKAELRVARVLACESLPKSKKLLKLKVDIGGQERQVLAGIAQHYAPDGLVGKLIVVVANLQPAKIMGEESQGMLLAASDEGGRLVVISPAGEIAPGARVQ